LRQRHIATLALAATQHDDQAASSSCAGLSAVCAHDGTCVPQESHERSLSVKSETRLRTSCHRSLIILDGEIPSEDNRHWKSHSLLEDTHLSLLTVNALRRSHELIDLVHEGYYQDSFYGDDRKRVSGRDAVRLEGEVGAFGVSVESVSRATLSSDRDLSMSCTTVS
jgi:hypothetical protein